MPLTAKGLKLKHALQREYGAKKGEQVLYAGKNKGTFTGVDSDCMTKDALRKAARLWRDADRQVVPPMKGDDERRYTIGQIRSSLTADRAAGFPRLKKALGR